MKNVLMLACLYPPLNNSGSVRSPKIAKYLTEFGWRPVVLASAIRPEDMKSDDHGPDGVSVYRTPPAFSFLNPYFRQDIRKGYWRYAVAQALKLIEKEKISVVFSTCAPMRTNLLARRIVEATGLPWVADFQDQWTDNHNMKALCRMMNWRTRQIEKKTIQKASFITTVTPAWAEAIARRHGRSADSVRVIQNGYDESDYPKDVTLLRDKFTITFIGSIYGEKFMDITPVLRGIALLRDRDGLSPEKLQLRFYGSDKDRIMPHVRQAGVGDFVEINERVSMKESLLRQAESAACLVLSWNVPEEKGVLPMKAVEYLGASRPILAVPGNSGDALDDFLRVTKAGVSCASAEEVARVLSDWLSIFGKTGRLPWSCEESACVSYTRRDQARRFAGLFDTAVRQRDF